MTMLLLASVLFIQFILCSRSFFKHVKQRQRFTPLPPQEQITPLWLQLNVFNHLPEVVGATWDKTVGTAEVATILSRLESEGKLQRIEEVSSSQSDRNDKKTPSTRNRLC